METKTDGFNFRIMTEEMNNCYKTCVCFLDIRTALGSKYNKNQEYKYKIFSLEELKDKYLEDKPVVVARLNHPRGTDRYTMEFFNKHFLDKAEWRNKQMDSILED
jgi:hypothetical protein